MKPEIQQQTHEMKSVEQTTCCIVGGGPAGVVLALLLARKGVDVMLLEAHMDFDRDFRGDTLHPSTMEILERLGLAERLLHIRHAEVKTVAAQTDHGLLTIADFSHLKTAYPYITVLSQAIFLNFITDEAKKYPHFHLIMGAQVSELLEENGNVCGVRYRGQDGWHEVRAILTVGADGRFSRMRRLAGVEAVKTSPPMDVLWFRVSRKEDDNYEGLTARFGKGYVVVVINRFEYLQIAFVIPKGGYQQLHAQGLEHLRKAFADAAPEMADRVNELQEWKQIAVLSVESDRLTRWYRPGLLLIGDAAHIMSPVGGVGINYAIQDAVVTANVLGEKLKYGILATRDLAKIQREREVPTRIIQAVQTFLQDRLFAPMIRSGQELTVPLPMRILLRIPLLRDIPARMIAYGPFPVNVK